MLRGVKSGAKAVGGMVRRGPDAMIERVQSQRGGKRDREISEESLLSPMEAGEMLTPVTTRDSEMVREVRGTPPKPKMGISLRLRGSESSAETSE